MGRGRSGSNRADRQTFFQPPPLTSNIFAATDQYQSLVPLLKDPFYICLETKAQGF